MYMVMARSKYTEIPQDDLCECLIVEGITKQDCDEKCSDENVSAVTSNISSEEPLIDEPEYNMYQKHKRKLSDCTFKQYGSNTLRNRQRKSHSLPGNCNLSMDDIAAEMELFQISAEDYATQLTLLDLQTFVAIIPEEFTSCCWNKHNKLQVTPNIVAFTKRFNQVCFWAVQEVLKGASPKQRAEIISYYIRIGKKLFDLNNFHSLFAIMSALKSASVYRLHKTWSYLSKKDKQQFDKLSEVFSEDDNWRNLREHVESLKLPCVPYLGMFLTDLVYVDVAHPHSGGMETEQRLFKMNNILRVISNLQQSKYNIPVLPTVQQYLKSIQYIEELQKFVEDDQYKLSLKLEPLSPVSSSCTVNSLCQNGSSCSSSKDSFLHDHCSMLIGTMATLNLSPAKLSTHLQHSNLVKDETLRRRKSLNLDASSLCTAINHQDFARHLIDDSVLEENASQDKLQIDKIKSRSWVIDKKPSTDESIIILEGYLKRKTVLKHGCHPAVTSSWHRYWVQMSTSFLFFYPPKCFKGSERNERCDFKRDPCKIWCIDRYIVSLTEKNDIFFLKDTHTSKTYKFKAINDIAALTWYRTLYGAAEIRCKESSPTNLITFE